MGKKPSLLSADLQPILYLLYSIVLTLGHTALKQRFLPKKSSLPFYHEIH